MTLRTSRILGLSGVDDATVADVARAEQYVLVAENVADFAASRDLVLVCVLKKNLPSGGAQATGVADLLDRWATTHPDPYVGHHRPT